MIPERLSRRKIRIKAKPLSDRASAFGGVQRRESTQIEQPQPDGAAAFEDFFDFEKQLSGMEPARETMSFVVREESQEEQEMIFEEAPPIVQVPSSVKKIDSKEEGTGFVVLEEIPSLIQENSKEFDFDFKPVTSSSMSAPPTAVSLKKQEDQETLYSKSIGFEFVQCSYQMASGSQCKRQAPKGSNICSIHMRVLNRKEKTSAL